MNEAKEVQLTKWETWLASFAERNKNLPCLLRLLGGLFSPASGLFAQFDLKLVQATEKQRLFRIAEFLEDCKRTFPPETKLTSLESEFFIQSFSLISRAVLYTSNRNKLRLFAHLLHHSCSINHETEADELEQMIRVVDDLSWREIELISWLNSFDEKYSLDRRKVREHRDTWNSYRDELKKKWNLSHDEFEDALVRLNRCGLCVYPTRTRHDHTQQFPRLTTLFRRFCEMVEISDVDLDDDPGTPLGNENTP